MRVKLLTFALFFCFTSLFTPLPAFAAGQLILGIHPYLPPTEIYDRFLPLAKYLGDETGTEVVISISQSYEEHIDRVGHDELDIAFMGPASYVLMVDKYGDKPLLAVLEIEGKHVFRGVIIKRTGSKIEKLSDLNGKRFAFGDPNSTMSHLVPRYMLWEDGVDVSDLSAYEHLSNHENVALGVLTGIFDAGAVKMEVFEEYKDKGLAALAYSPVISEHVFVTSSKLDEKTVAALRTALLALDKKDGGKAVLQSIKEDVTALVPVSELDYKPLRMIMRKLRELGVSP